PPMARPRNQAKKPAHMENTPTYSRAIHADAATACVGQVSQAPGTVMGNAITHTQQMTRSAPSVAVTCAPYTYPSEAEITAPTSNRSPQAHPNPPVWW